MGAPFWGRGDRIPKAGTGSVSWAQIREEGRRDRMRRRQEVKEDDPFMASSCQHAQSKLVCIARKKQVNVSVTLYSCTYCIYCFRKINHLVPVPFVLILRCKKPCREQFIFSGTPDNRQPTDNRTRTTERTTEGNGMENGQKSWCGFPQTIPGSHAESRFGRKETREKRA
jgi:hypothetical protein